MPAPEGAGRADVPASAGTFSKRPARPAPLSTYSRAAASCNHRHHATMSPSPLPLFLPPQVNVAAVNRFISAAVPDLSQEQKAALKGAGQRGAGGAAAGAAGGTRKRKSGGGSEGAEGEEAAGEGDASGAAAAAAFLQETMEELQGQGAVPEKQQQQQEAGSGKKRRKGGA